MTYNLSEVYAPVTLGPWFNKAFGFKITQEITPFIYYMGLKHTLYK